MRLIEQGQRQPLVWPTSSYSRAGRANCVEVAAATLGWYRRNAS
ncbi:hypothetical protein ACFQ07_01515 [Actinomadura adrarensis]|uniref:DUF397 domain-containing protein n=1 Tax=Actinomadura adrarensis TaxID=1819600 RepID=A0ABW3C8W7_9ACTN